MSIPEDWLKKSNEHTKLYKNYLQRADKKKVLRALPDLHEQAFEQINCLDCGNCCRNHSPRFKMPDIKRISKSMNMKETEFIGTYLRMDTEGDYVTKTSPCPFLDMDNNECGIYEDRPSDCARYPYTDEDVLLKRPLLTLKNATICPAVYVVMEKLLEVK
jgi:uncharacterized protein